MKLKFKPSTYAEIGNVRIQQKMLIKTKKCSIPNNNLF